WRRRAGRSSACPARRSRTAGTWRGARPSDRLRTCPTSDVPTSPRPRISPNRPGTADRARARAERRPSPRNVTTAIRPASIAAGAGSALLARYRASPPSSGVSTYDRIDDLELRLFELENELEQLRRLVEGAGSEAPKETDPVVFARPEAPRPPI